MDDLESDVFSNVVKGDEVDSTVEDHKLPEVKYFKKTVHSFGEGVEDIVKGIKSSPEGDNGRTVVMWDIDGVLIENKLTQYPGICHFFDHNVSEKVKGEMEYLISEIGQDAVTIATNRDEKVRVIWSSERIVNTIQDALEAIDYPSVKIFTGLSKQVPGAARKKREPLVDHYVNYIIDNDVGDNLRICVIEDYSIIGLDRKVFPKEIARKIQEGVREKTGRRIGVDIMDYVLKP